MNCRWKLLVIINIAFSAFAVRFISDWARRDEFSVPLVDPIRFKEFMFNIDIVTRNSRSKTLFLGTSVFHYFLDPEFFDSRMRELGVDSQSYNLAFAGMMGTPKLAFVQRIAHEFEIRDAKFKTSIIEFSPVSYASAFYERHRESLDVWSPRIFLNSASWIDLFFEDPRLASLMWVDEWLRPFDIFSLRGLNKFFVVRTYNPNRFWEGVAALWFKDIFIEKHRWNIQRRGLANWNLPQTREEFDRAIAEIHSPQNWSKLVENAHRFLRFDRGFAISERMFDFFLESVRQAKRFSREVYVVVPPYAPDLQVLANRNVNYEYYIDRIQTETSVKVLDGRKILQLSNNDFADFMHLNHAAMARFGNALANQIFQEKE